MDHKHSLSTRIVMVFALMTAFVAGFFAVGIVATVHVVERKLTTISLGGNLHRLLLMESPEQWTHRPDKSELFFVEDGPADLNLAPALDALPEGFSEVAFEGQPYYAMTQVVDGRRYVLLRDQVSLKQRERVLFLVVTLGFALSILLAIFLGWLLARRVMAPVVRLASQVRHRDQLLALAPPLAPDYTSDEVGELATSFDQTLGRLRAALGREKLFTSDVSHELRTPLMVLASSCELLLDNRSLDVRSQAQVGRIARASAEMRQLVDTFLMLARTENRTSHLGPTTCLEDVADALTEVWGRLIKDKGLEFFYCVEQRSTARYNLTFVQAVMGNLLRNAWHYTDHGFIRLSLYEQGFVVEDSGIGIPEEKRNAMFQPFVRGDEQRGEGLGLGLSLVQRICSHQHWRVTLDSREPNGCRFSVDLRSLADTDRASG
ncbi:sensor histidine kinase [Pseudomonas chlororaphis]|uniref:histidine kinase n=1 Tax=Pseudomonas chlororaphis TaxID=587753 RepID=A0A1Q8ERD6_9PSED|nr:sensor histidine kinase [Pseudomonas chlororaphis]OLF54340.1 two-component sensor histidine kinase [Pseudomonas chlororaphis]